jgi:hypothetical protein
MSSFSLRVVWSENVLDLLELSRMYELTRLHERCCCVLAMALEDILATSCGIGDADDDGGDDGGSHARARLVAMVLESGSGV